MSDVSPSVSVSGCPTWKIEETRPQLFFNFGSEQNFLKLVGEGGVGQERNRRQKIFIFLKLSNSARKLIRIFLVQTFLTQTFSNPAYLASCVSSELLQACFCRKQSWLLLSCCLAAKLIIFCSHLTDADADTSLLPAPLLLLQSNASSNLPYLILLDVTYIPTDSNPTCQLYLILLQSCNSQVNTTQCQLYILPQQPKTTTDCGTQQNISHSPSWCQAEYRGCQCCLSGPSCKFKCYSPLTYVDRRTENVGECRGGGWLSSKAVSLSATPPSLPPSCSLLTEC